MLNPNIPELSRDIIDLVVEYVTVLHTPGLRHIDALRHLCAPGSRALKPARDLSRFKIMSFRASRAGEDRVRVHYRAGETFERSVAINALFRAEKGKLVEVAADWNNSLKSLAA